MPRLEACSTSHMGISKSPMALSIHSLDICSYSLISITTKQPRSFFLSKTPGILQKRSEELRYNFANRIQAEYTAYKTSKTFNYLE